MMRNWLYLLISAAGLAQAALPAQVEIEYDLSCDGHHAIQGQPWHGADAAQYTDTGSPVLSSCPRAYAWQIAVGEVQHFRRPRAVQTRVRGRRSRAAEDSGRRIRYRESHPPLRARGQGPGRALA